MGRYLIPGHQYIDGQTVTGPSLTEHVADAVLKATAISEQLEKDPATLTDELLINDGGNLKKLTLQSLKSIILLTLTSEELSDEVRIPVGSVIDFAGTSAPDGWLFCHGQTLSRETPYDRLFDAIGTTYGAGDGSTTFRLPDCRGRVTAGKDNMGGTSANRMSVQLNGDVLGAVGGTERYVLTEAEIPSHTHSYSDQFIQQTAGVGLAGGNNAIFAAQAFITGAIGGSGGHSNTQPTIIFNKIIRYL